MWCKKSDISFLFYPLPTSGHHLEIQVQSQGSCLQWGRPRFSAAVHAEPSQDQKFILSSAYKMADKRACWAKNKGGLLHELFHLFGIMHTQMRPDRDQHITILSHNIQRSYSREYDVSKRTSLNSNILTQQILLLRYVMSAITMGFPMIVAP